MRRHMLNIIVIGILTVVAAGCSSELATTTAPAPEALAPRVGDGGLKSAALKDYVKTCEWTRIEFAYPASGDAVLTFVPEGYPASLSVTIDIHRDAGAGKPGDRGVLWLPAAPDGEAAPSDLTKYVVFRTQNIPADANTHVDIHLPVTPWQDTMSWDGNFAMYHLGDDATGWIAYPDGSPTSVQWPDGGSYTSLRLHLGALPDKDDTGTIVDQVADPETSGDNV